MILSRLVVEKNLETSLSLLFLKNLLVYAIILVEILVRIVGVSLKCSQRMAEQMMIEK